MVKPLDGSREWAIAGIQQSHRSAPLSASPSRARRPFSSFTAKARMTQHLFILTGASRGMGAAIAESTAAAGPLPRLSRHVKRGALAARAQTAGVVCEQWAADLALPIEAAARAPGLAGAHASTFANAHDQQRGRLRPGSGWSRPAPMPSRRRRCGSASKRRCCCARHALMGCRRVRAEHCLGLGRRAMAAEAPYSAAKAGLDHYSRVLALDAQALQANGARVVSLARA